MTNRRTRVYLLNNYPLDAVGTLVAEGRLGSQHLWGMTQLEDDFEWVASPRALIHARVKGWRLTFGFALMSVVGDVRQQAFAWRRAGRGSIIYAADQQSATLLGLARRLGLLKTPLVIMLHNGPRLRWSRFCVQGADRLLVLDRDIAPRVGLSHANVRAMPWGPDLRAHMYAHATASRLAVDFDFTSAGKTNRDYSALMRAAETHRLTGMIFQRDSVTQYHAGEKVTEHRTADMEEVLSSMARSSCVVIALDDPSRLSGLTEAADAIALSVPMVVSDGTPFPYHSSPRVRFIETDDAGSLYRAIATPWPADATPGLADRFNMDVFAAELRHVFLDLQPEDLS